MEALKHLNKSDIFAYVFTDLILKSSSAHF